MSRKTLVWTMLVVGCLTSVAAASINCNDSYLAGRAALLDGSLSGLRDAYVDFNEAMGSSACASNNNLVFLHALSRTAMLFIDDSNLALADSFIDIANGFGVTIVGDYFDELNLSVPMSGGCYTIPPGAPDANEIYLRIQNSVIPEINNIIAELNTIKDTASKRFLISFSPSETGLDKTVKVDYSEVLILKGLLLALKSQLEFKQVYNLTVDPNDPAVQDMMNHVFCDTDALPNGAVNNLLGNYPDLLTVLPGGKAILAQSKQDMINAINYYFAVVKYLQAMKAPQDHLIYIDADAKPTVASIAIRLTTLQNSLKKDTAGKYVWETIKTYKVRKGSKVIGNLVLVYDVTGLRSGDGGTLTFTSSVTPASWQVDDFGGTGADFGIDMDSSSEERWGWFEGTLSSDGKKITKGSFEYWDEYDDNTITGLSAQLSKTQTIYKRLDLNPVFGSKRYPTPVSPRNLLPQFDNSNLVIPGTVGHGLGNATLGGIVPDMNPQDWEH